MRLLQAIEEDNTEAMYYMGLLYSNGQTKGLEKSDEKAMEWFRKAAEDEKFPSDKGQVRFRVLVRVFLAALRLGAAVFARA